MYRHIRPSSITFTSSSSDTILLSLLHLPLSLSLSVLSDARDLRRPPSSPLELACILRDLCNRWRRRRHHLPNDIHAEDASVPAKKEALPNNCGERAKSVAFLVCLATTAELRVPWRTRKRRRSSSLPPLLSHAPL